MKYSQQIGKHLVELIEELIDENNVGTTFDKSKKYPSMSTHDLKPGDTFHADGNHRRGKLTGEVTKVNPKKIHYRAEYGHTKHHDDGTSSWETHLNLNTNKHELDGALVARPHAVKSGHFRFYTLKHSDRK